MQGSIIDQGLELMLFGMGTVLFFLTLLVIAISLMSRFIQRFFPEVEPALNHGADAANQSVAPGLPIENANLIAVISAAIHQHRSKKPK